MNKFSLFFSMVLLVYVVLTCLGLKVTFKPFSVSFETWKSGLVWLVFIISFVVLMGIERADGRKSGFLSGYRQGLKDGGDYTLKMISDSLTEHLKKPVSTELETTSEEETINH